MECVPPEVLLEFVLQRLDLRSVARFGAACRHGRYLARRLWEEPGRLPWPLLEFVRVMHDRHVVEQVILRKVTEADVLKAPGWRSTRVVPTPDEPFGCEVWLRWREKTADRADIGDAVYEDECVRVHLNVEGASWTWPPGQDVSYGRCARGLTSWQRACLDHLQASRSQLDDYFDLPLPLAVLHLVCAWMMYPSRTLQLVPPRILARNLAAAAARCRRTDGQVWVPLFGLFGSVCGPPEMTCADDDCLWNVEDHISDTAEITLSCRSDRGARGWDDPAAYLAAPNFVRLSTDLLDDDERRRFLHRDEEGKDFYYVDARLWMVPERMHVCMVNGEHVDSPWDERALTSTRIAAYGLDDVVDCAANDCASVTLPRPFWPTFRVAFLPPDNDHCF